MQLVVGGRTHLDEDWYAIGTAPANTVEHQAMQVDVEVGGPEALDQHDGAAVAFVGPKSVSRLGAIQQMALQHALHPLHHPRDQLGLRSLQQAQRDRQRQGPLPQRLVRGAR